MILITGNIVINLWQVPILVLIATVRKKIFLTWIKIMTGEYWTTIMIKKKVTTRTIIEIR